MGAGIEVTELTVNDGSCIECEGYDVVLIAAPNNRGKTQCLMDLHQQIINAQPQEGVVVTSGKVLRRGTSDDVWAVIRTVGTPDPGQNDHYRVPLSFAAGAITAATIADWNNNVRANPVEPLFVTYLGPDGRERISNPAPAIGRQMSTLPLHHLHENREFRMNLTGGFRRAFGQDIAPDFNAGNILPPHVGENAGPMEGESEHGDDEYRDRLRRYPRINEQGHGMRSFTGILRPPTSWCGW